MTMSYILYIGVLAICWLLAFQADRKDNKFFVWLIVLVLTLVTGLRGSSVGLDTKNYVEKFSLIEQGQFQYAYGLETSFKYICAFFLKIFPGYSVLLGILGLITNGFIIWRLWDFRSIASFSCMVSCYYMGFFFMSLNGIRQFCAIAILLFATRYLIKHKYLRYIVFVFIASAFHQSALIGLPFVAFELLRWKLLSTRQKVLFIGLALVSPVILVYAIQRLSRYAGYFEQVRVDVGLMVPLKIVFFFATAAFVFLIYGGEKHFWDWEDMTAEDKSKMLLGGICYFIGLILIFTSYFLPMMNRVGWFFTIYEGIYMGMLVKTRKPMHKLIFIYCVAFLLGYAFIDSMIYNTQGVMPYVLA